MRLPLCIAIAGAWLGASSCLSTDPETFEPEHHSWPRIMEKVIEPTWEKILLPAADQDFGSIDLSEIRARSERAAHYLAYAMQLDPHDDVAGFDEAATNANRWLLGIVGAAESGDVEGVQALIRGGEARYCDRCHDLLP
jgi:hypothetical protein